jgi:hypothetical protein
VLPKQVFSKDKILSGSVTLDLAQAEKAEGQHQNAACGAVIILVAKQHFRPSHCFQVLNCC